ncbi:MAG TPA: hypothetical protein ENN22_03580 [bacterium]|nr:hypothetical protein [bacterium]
MVHRHQYPFDDARFDSRIVSFVVNGQFGDAVFEIIRAKTHQLTRLWVTDFLSGKLFIISPE